MRAELFTIRRSGPGTLSTMARPRGGDWLEDEMNSLTTADVDVLVSLLSNTEITELQLTAEPELEHAAGLAFCHLPTPDRHVPDQAASLALAETLTAQLARGASIAIHCRNGIGRASTLAAIILVLEGTDPRLAWTMISAARGMTVPDTAAQRDSITSLRPAR